MTALDLTPGSRTSLPPLGWVVPGPLRQVTGGYLYDARVVDGLRAAGWPVGVLDIRAGGWPLDIAAGRRLVSGLSRQRWSAVVIDELAHPALTAALLAGRLHAALNGAPLVLLVHHLRCSEPSPLPSRLLARLVETAALRAADLVICTSETTVQTVRPLARRGASVAVVRPGWDTHADLAPPSPVVERDQGDEARGGVAAQTPGVRLLLVGHWTPRKGILQALAALEQADASVSLDLVGEQDRDMSYAANVWAALQSPGLAGRVRAHGRVPDSRLRELFATADALLLPSTHEGYGMVLAEALAAGLPIIATRAGAVPEVVRDGQEAELVPVNDIPALVGAIDRLARSPDERQRRSVLARERARSLPTWAESIGAFAELLAGVARRS